MDWLQWAEEQSRAGHLPSAWAHAIRLVVDGKPTAELRPKGEEQTDEKDLMPYPVLDAIERLAIGSKMGPVAVLKHLEVSHSQYSVAELGAWVRRFFVLWSRNQWKRERYAPSFHLDDENLDPKTWCRFPILSAGFEKELADLAEYMQQ